MDSDYLKPTGAQTRKFTGFTSRSEPLLAHVEGQPEAADSTPSPNLAPTRRWAHRSWFPDWNLNLFKPKPSSPTGAGSSIQGSNAASDSECPVSGRREEVSRLPRLGFMSVANFTNWNWQTHNRRPSGCVSRSTSPVSSSASELDDIPSPPGAFQSLHSLAHSLVNDTVAPESITVDENPSLGQGRSGASDQTGTWAEFPVASAQVSRSAPAGITSNWQYSSTLHPLKLAECILAFRTTTFLSASLPRFLMKLQPGDRVEHRPTSKLIQRELRVVTAVAHVCIRDKEVVAVAAQQLLTASMGGAFQVMVCYSDNDIDHEQVGNQWELCATANYVNQEDPQLQDCLSGDLHEPVILDAKGVELPTLVALGSEYAELEGYATWDAYVGFKLFHWKLFLISLIRHIRKFEVHIAILCRLISHIIEDSSSEGLRALRSYIIAACTPKIHTRFRHRRSVEFIHALRAVDPVSVKFVAALIPPVDQATSSQRVTDADLIECLGTLSDVLRQGADEHLPPLIKRAKEIHGEKDLSLYTESTCGHFHWLFIELITLFERVLDLMSEKRGKALPPSEFMKLVDTAWLVGEALRSLAWSRAIQIHLKMIAPQLMKVYKRSTLNPLLVQTADDDFDWLVDVEDISQRFWDWSRLLVVHLDAPMIIHGQVSSGEFQARYKSVSAKILCPPVVSPELLSFKKLLNSTHFPTTSPKSAHTNEDIIEFVWQKIRLLRAWRRLKVLRQLVEANPKSLDDQKSPDGQPPSGKDLSSKLKTYQALFKNVTEILLAKLREAGSPDDRYSALISAVGAVNDSYKSYSAARNAFRQRVWLDRASDDPSLKDTEQVYILRDRIAEFFNELQQLVPDQHHEGFFNSCFNTLTEKERGEFEFEFEEKEKEKDKGKGREKEKSGEKGKGKGKGKEHVGLERPAVGRPHCEAWLALLITLLWRNQADPDSPPLHSSLQAIKEHFQVCCIYFA